MIASAHVEAESPKKRVFPLLIVLIMAVLLGAAVLYATVANGYEGTSYSPVQKPVIVEKQLEEGTPADDTTEFQFELIVSPGFIDNTLNQIDKGSSAVTSVKGIIYDAKGDLFDEKSYPIEGHKIKFSLKAGQKILFKELPFAAQDEDCGFIVNELIGDDSDAAKAGYGYSKAVVTSGAEFASTDEAYTSRKLDTGTLAKAIYDVYEEYLYTYNCWDADWNPVDNPDLDGTTYYSNVYFNKATDPAMTNWYINVDEGSGWVYYDIDGNRVDSPDTSSGEYNDGSWLLKDKKPYLRAQAIQGDTPITHATEVTIFNRIMPIYKPFAIEKQLEGDAVADGTNFTFEITVSPDQVDTKDAIANTTVAGTLYKADGSESPVTYQLDDHKMTLQLKAGERVVFDKMPFSRADSACSYVVKESSYDAGTAEDGSAKASYEFSKIEATDGDEDAANDPAIESVTDATLLAGALGASQGTCTTGDTTTTVTVYNKQESTTDDPTPATHFGAISVSKALENAQPDATEFDFELVISPEWKGTPYALGTDEKPVTITGITSSGGNVVGEAQYSVANNTVLFTLKADEKITFPSIPYLSVEGKPGTFVVNELVDDASGYVFKTYTADDGIDLGLDAAKTTKDETDDHNPIFDQVAVDANGNPTGAYGQLAAQVGDTSKVPGVTFVNARSDGDGRTLAVKKSLEGFDFAKYPQASVAFNVYRFETEADCTAFVNGTGDASKATWKGALGVHFTANGIESAELTGLSEGYYAVEEISATNMKAVGLTRKPVHIGADATYEVSFDNRFDDKGIRENSIVNSYEKIIGSDGKITWQKYQNGVPVND